MISERSIIPRKMVTGKGWLTLYDLTKKGKMILADLGYEVKSESEGVVHKFWKHRVSDFYRKKGLDVRIEEYYVNGRPNIIVAEEKRKTAIEIEIGKSDYIGNVVRALKADFDEVICVVVNKLIEKKIKKELSDKGIVDERVKVVGIGGY